MYSSDRIKWDEEADVVVVGFGGAGAVSAIAAHDAASRVVILEKQDANTPTRTNHTPSTRLSGGGWFCPTSVDKAIMYMEALVLAANETLDEDRKDTIAAFAKYAVENTAWLKQIGLKVATGESLVVSAKAFAGLDAESKSEGASLADPLLARMFAGIAPENSDGVFMADLPSLPGSDGARVCMPAAEGTLRNGEALFAALSNAVQARGIDIMWGMPGAHLVTEGGEVRGVVASRQGKELAIRARRGVVLSCGGFEYNDVMKENFLRVTPAFFTGNPASTGDGINMAQEVGATLWHMNCCSWRVVMKVPGFPVALNVRRAELASIFVDRRGKRFTNERFKGHGLGYELTNYDAHAICYPRVPCYWIFDEKRRAFGSLTRRYNRPSGDLEHIRYSWSEDNLTEIDRGWVIRANTLDELASKIQSDSDDGGLMSASVLHETVKQYNEYCRKREDADFHKPLEYLQPIEDSPYYAVKLWPGGPNTQGGPRRNSKGQVLRPNLTPIPRLYCAGELGSVWGMLYQVGGNLAECISFGRICGENVAAENRWE